MTRKTKGFPAWVVKANDQGDPYGLIDWLTEEDLPTFDEPSVTIEVQYSSLNYKDALACRGHRGVAGPLPHVPGIDCAGSVLRSDSTDYAVGDQVLVTGYDLGGKRWGGYSGCVRVPADWVVAMPDGLTTRQAMTYGTAGFTAAQCVKAVSERVSPDAGEVVVTGATGGVGCFSVALLAKLGYRVTAVTGKPDRADRLRQLGASEVVGRDAVTDDGTAPLLSERWAGAVDTVGGAPLMNVLRSTRHRGVVAACGLVAGAELSVSLYPFLLRGVTLAGIDSAKCPRTPRLDIWKRLAGPWRVDLADELVTIISLDSLPDAIECILAGGMTGRTLVTPDTASKKSD